MLRCSGAAVVLVVGATAVLVLLVQRMVVLCWDTVGHHAIIFLLALIVYAMLTRLHSVATSIWTALPRALLMTVCRRWQVACRVVIVTIIILCTPVCLPWFGNHPCVTDRNEAVHRFPLDA